MPGREAEFHFGGLPGLSGGLQIVKASKVIFHSPEVYRRVPATSTQENAGHATSIVPLHRSVHHVDLMRDVAKVVDFVVGRIAIDMVNCPARPSSMIMRP